MGVFVIVDSSGASTVAQPGQPASQAAAWQLEVAAGQTSEEVVGSFVTAQGFPLKSRVYMVDAGSVQQYKLGANLQALGLPGAPTGILAVEGNAQATVSWTPPSDDGGTEILGYLVTSLLSGTAQTSVQVGPAPSAVVTGLANGMAYSFEVQAINSVGIGPSSLASVAVTPTAPPSPPSAPTNVSARASAGQADVSWTAPASDGGAPISDYNVVPHDGLTAQVPYVVTGSPPPTEVVVTGLQNGTQYTFQVVAINSAGASPPSAASAPATP